MKQRSSEILQYLIVNETQRATLKQLSEKYQISVKTLRRDLLEIDDFLNNIPIRKIQILPDGSIRSFSPEEKNEIQSALSQNFHAVYIMSHEERQTYIIVLLLKADRYITMNEIAAYLCVSRITILNDMVEVEKIIASYSGNLYSRPGMGIRLEIEEYSARCLIVDILKESFFTSNKEYEIPGIYYYKMIEELKDAVNIACLNQILKEFEKTQRMQFSGKGFRLVLFYLYAFANRSKISDEEISIPENKEVLQKAQTILRHVCQAIGREPSVTESLLLMKFMQENHVLLPSADVNAHQGIYAVVVRFLYQISMTLDICLYDDYSLFEFLSLHLLAMAQRIRSRETQRNVLKESLKEEYPEVYEAVVKNIKVIEDYFDIQIDDNELSYIVMHLCADLIRRESKRPRLRTKIICPDSIAGAQFLSDQVRQYFNVDVVKTITVNHSAEEDDTDVDFILSTVAFQKGNVPVLVVEPILTSESCDRIQALIYALIRKRMENVRSSEDKDSVSHLYQVIRPETIWIDPPVSKWREALRDGGDLLVDQQLTWKSFTSNIIEIVELNGPYIVMQKGLAIAHALCPDARYQNAVSLIVLKEGISFGVPQLDPVHLLFCMSIRESKSYMRIISDLLEIGKDRTYFQELLACKDRAEAYHLIVMKGILHRS